MKLVKTLSAIAAVAILSACSNAQQMWKKKQSKQWHRLPINGSVFL